MFEDILFGNDKKNDNTEIFPIISNLDDFDLSSSELPETLPLLTIRNSVLFPKLVIPITLGRKKSLKLVKSAFKKENLIGIISQTDESVDDPDFKDIYKIGTLAKVIKLFEMPDGEQTAVLQGIKRFKIVEELTTKPNLTVKYEILNNIEPKKSEKQEFDAKLFSVKELSVKIIHLSVNIPKEATFAVKNIDNPEFLINFVSSNSDLKTEDKQLLLEENILTERAGILIKYLAGEVQKLELKNNIQNKAKSEMNQQQKE
jgi:ATP-dependent Lon protease